jgi:hypothetical protein
MKTVDLRPPLPAFIDSSMLTTFRACPKKFEYEYRDCLRPAGRKVDLVAGSAFAAALEAAYVARFADGKNDFDSLAQAYRAFAESWGDFEDVGDSAKNFDRTFQAVLSYFETYPFDSDHVRPLMRQDGQPSFEFTFAIPLEGDGFPLHPSGDPFIYSGRFDAFGHLDGRLVIRDEKTTGRKPQSNWSAQWDLRNQFLGYCWAATRSGFPTNTVVVRGIGILRTMFHHVEAVKLYPPFLIERFEQQLARDLHRLVDCWESGYFDYNLGDTCTNYGLCSFHLLCTEPNPEVWHSDFVRERWDPLTRTSTPIEELEAA